MIKKRHQDDEHIAGNSPFDPQMAKMEKRSHKTAQTAQMAQLASQPRPKKLLKMASGCKEWFEEMAEELLGKIE